MAITLKPINTKLVTFTIIGTSPLIQHKFSAKIEKQLKDKKLGKTGRVKKREISDPEQEFQDATHLTADGEYGIPAGALKKCIINAAHKDIGIEKTLVRKSLFIRCDDPENVLALDCDPPIMREDIIRVSNGAPDVRWRPEFKEWSCEITAEIDADNMPVDALINLVDRAGFGVGLHEQRPEKGGEFGRFRVDTTKEVKEAA